MTQAAASKGLAFRTTRPFSGMRAVTTRSRSSAASQKSRSFVHIFQFARPEGYISDKLADKEKDAAGKPRKYDNRQNSYWYRQKKEREEAEKKLRLKKEVESADLDELAAAAGSAVGLPEPTATSSGAAIAVGAAAGSVGAGAAAAAAAKPSGSRTSGRKRSGEQISYNENTGDKEFEKQLRAFEKQMPAPVLKGFASVEGVVAGKKTGGDYDSDDEEEKELRPIDEIIDALHQPGKLTFSFLAPDTHLTGPCYRDFNRHVKSFPGWTAKRIKASDEEKKKHKFKKKGSAYFLKLIFTIPGKAVAKKKSATGTGTSKKTKPATEDKNPILAEAAALAARQLEARKAREAKEPAKKKAKSV